MIYSGQFDETRIIGKKVIDVKIDKSPESASGGEDLTIYFDDGTELLIYGSECYGKCLGDVIVNVETD